jgi:hypothetical protein
MPLIKELGSTNDYAGFVMEPTIIIFSLNMVSYHIYRSHISEYLQNFDNEIHFIDEAIT